MSAPRPEPEALKAELTQMARQVERMATNAKMGGEGVGVRVKDPIYLADLLHRAAEAI